MFKLSFSCFSLLYCVRPQLPALAGLFALSPSASSPALSISTSLLAVAGLAPAPRAKGHAASIYLLADYRGSSLIGSVGGRLWSAGGHTASVAAKAMLEVKAH